MLNLYGTIDLALLPSRSDGTLRGVSAVSAEVIAR